MVKDFVSANNVTQIRKLLRVLGQDFTLSQNQNSRKGGLIGLAATAIALSRVFAVIIFRCKLSLIDLLVFLFCI